MLELIDYSFTYDGQDRPSLSRLNLHIAPGELVLLCGPSGSGKSTLLQNLKPNIAPVGQVSGTIAYQGRPLALYSERELAEEIAILLDDPREQCIMGRVIQELAFAMENLAYRPEVMRRRMAELVTYFGMGELLERDPLSLSGGELQAVNLAAVLVLAPQVLLLDEPLSHLDPLMAVQFLQLLLRLQEEQGLTIILCEHNFVHLLPHLPRVVLLEAGEIVFDGDPDDACRYFFAQDTLRSFLPPLPDLALTCGLAEGEKIPYTIPAGRRWASKRAWQYVPDPAKAQPEREVLLQGRSLRFCYSKAGGLLLDGVDIALQAGVFCTLFGGNGSGKTTLLKLFAGDESPLSGQMTIDKPVGYLSQTPKAYFMTDRVASELARQKRLLTRQEAVALEAGVVAFGLDHLRQQHPYDLSHGEQMRLALLLVLSRKPRVLLLDEPTNGLDPLNKQHLGDILRQHCAQGGAILMASHDLEFAATYAHVGTMLFQGQLTSPQEMGAFLRDNRFYTTDIRRTFVNLVPEAVTLADVAEVAR